MRLANKAGLRNTLKKLAAMGHQGGESHDRATAAQEALDFVAMLAGIKPVLLLGRGFDDAQWLEGALRIATDLRLHVVEGAYWDAEPSYAGLPEWYSEHARAAFQGYRAHYVCKARAVAHEVAELCRSGTPSIEDEARLLGYPRCCVEAHHGRERDYQLAWLSVLEREAGGDEAGMRRLLANGAALAPATGGERARLEAAMAVQIAPFTSVNMCAACAGSSDGPARSMSRRYGELARSLDPGLARSLAAASVIAGAP